MLDLLEADVLDRRLRPLHGRIVDEHVEAPAGGRRGLVDRAASEFGILDVAFDQQAPRAPLLDERASLLRVLAFLAIDDRDAFGAFGREVNGHRSADSAVSARDDAVATLEAFRSDVARPNDLGLGVH